MNTSLPQPELRARLSGIEPFLNATAIFILATIFMFWEASRAVYVLLSLAALVFVVKFRPEMPADHRLYSWPIIGYIGTAILSFLANGMSDHGLSTIVSRFFLLLLAIPVASVFYLSFDLKRNAWIKFVIGCMALGGAALVDILLLDKVRANAGYNASAFGFTALAMTSVVIGSYYRFSQARFGRAVFCLAILMGVCAMILSGTRTSWMAGIIVMVIALFFYLDRYSLFKRVAFALTLTVTMLIIGSSLPLVQKRFVVMFENISPYVKGEEQTEFNSLRTRVELWKLGWSMGMENKMFGFGPGNTKREIREHAQQNPHDLKRIKSVHVHNQFVQSFAMTGLVGLFSFLALVACHFRIFTKYLGKQYSLEVRCLALSGVLLLISYLIKSVPGVPFYGRQYLLMYGIASATIWGSLLGALRESGPVARESDNH